ncbi:MAG TPA: Uma2 family endonuclease [Thermoanaerobaculia bacterium]|nr:Uma2 family endonuclease [Thermoanaerobaculia bacterium]
MIKSQPSLKLTYQDFLELQADGKGRELIDGDLHVTPAATTRHQAVLLNLLRVLGNFVHQGRVGVLLPPLTDVLLSPVDVVHPDALFVGGDRLELIKENHVAGAPDLAIEILSPASRRIDARIKLRLYERHGVQEYWIVDPELETIEVYCLAQGAYQRIAELALERREVLTSPLFPGLSIPLLDVFD